MPQNAPSCIHGHEFTPENTYIRQDLPTPVRVCRTCVRQRALRRYHSLPVEMRHP